MVRSPQDVADELIAWAEETDVDGFNLLDHGTTFARHHRLGIELSHRLSGLIYWNGQYVEISHDTDLDLLAEVSIPLAYVR